MKIDIKWYFCSARMKLKPATEGTTFFYGLKQDIRQALKMEEDKQRKKISNQQ